MESKPKTLIAIGDALFRDLFGAEELRRLRQLSALETTASEQRLTSSQLAEALGGVDIVITGWGTPVFTDEALAAADKLKLIAHSAGTIKLLLPPPVFAHGTRVTHVAAALAPPVGEATLLFILLALRRFHDHDRAFKAGGWAAARAFELGRELAGQVIGIVGAGLTGREAMRCLRALDAELWVYDPYLGAEEAAALGARRVALEGLLRECPIVSLHAPSTEETYQMIGADQFAMLGDGAIFVNTARAHLIDEAALLAELQTGRIYAALDVFEHEPLPEDSLFRQLQNVIITPHIAAHTQQARARQGRYCVDEIERFLRGESLRYEVTRAKLDIMA